MAQQTIGIGTTANDGTGDTARAAFGKVNDNFDELYQAKGGQTVYVNNFGAIGDGSTHPLSERYASLEAAQAACEQHERKKNHVGD
jgi:hypothetical protein